MEDPFQGPTAEITGESPTAPEPQDLPEAEYRTNGSNRYDELEEEFNDYFIENYDDYIDGTVRLVHPMWTETHKTVTDTQAYIVNGLGSMVSVYFVGKYSGVLAKNSSSYGASNFLTKIAMGYKVELASGFYTGVGLFIIGLFKKGPFIEAGTSYRYMVNAQFSDTSYFGVRKKDAYFYVNISPSGEISASYNEMVGYMDDYYSGKYGN